MPKYSAYLPYSRTGINLKEVNELSMNFKGKPKDHRKTTIWYLSLKKGENTCLLWLGMFSIVILSKHWKRINGPELKSIKTIMRSNNRIIWKWFNRLPSYLRYSPFKNNYNIMMINNNRYRVCYIVMNATSLTLAKTNNENIIWI